MLRGIYGFDHCVRTQSPVLNGVLNSPEVGFGTQATLSAPTSLAVDQNGFLGSYRSVESYVGFDLTGILPPNTTKATFGFRLLTLQALASLHSLLHFTVPSLPADVSYYLVSMGVANSWQPVQGVEVYAELTYDFVAYTATLRVDGVNQPFIAGPALGAAVKAAFTAGTGMISFRLSSGGPSRYAIRDFYIVDAVVGDGMTGPLGAQRMYPIVLDQADGAGWTPSAGGTALNTINAALPATPYVTSPSDKTPLVTSLKTTAPAGTRVNAVSLALSGTSLGDSPSVSKIELSQGGADAAAKFVPVAKTATYGAQIGIFPKAPDGAAWDIAKIDATVLKLTPDTSA